jgi:hypothetical protein
LIKEFVPMIRANIGSLTRVEAFEIELHTFELERMLFIWRVISEGLTVLSWSQMCGM